MALDPSARYPGQTNTSDAAYPYGKAQNVDVEGDGTGFPFEKDFVNDILGAQQALLAQASITPSGAPDQVGASQYLAAVQAVSAQSARLAIAAAGAQEWRSLQLPSGPTYQFLVTTTIPDRTQRAVVAIGASGSVAGFVRSLGSGQFEALEQNWGSEVGPFFVTDGALGTFYFNNSTNLVRHVDLTTQSTAAATNVEAFFYAGGSPTPFMYFTSDAQIYKSASFGSGYGAAARPSGMTAFQLSAAGVPGGEFAYNGGDDICFNSVITISGVTRSRVLRSVDGGTTWTLAFTAAPGVSLSIIYAERNGTFLFAILASDGNLYWSDDGFVAATSTPITAAAGASQNYSTFAACGKVIAKAIDTAIPTASGSFGGIAYSVDAGATWRYAAVSDESAFGSSEGLGRLISANGRLWALHGDRVYMSGQID